MSGCYELNGINCFATNATRQCLRSSDRVVLAIIHAEFALKLYQDES